MIYTFYSYKGGVGRSMAMANVAEWFYLQGLRVVIIDWDLEAPGLENFYYNKEEDLDIVRSQLGLIDMLMAYKRFFPRLSLESERESVAGTDDEGDEKSSRDLLAIMREQLPPLSNMLYPIHPPKTSSDKSPALWLLPAGWRSGDRFPIYAQTVQSFDWADFYASYQGEVYFEWMRTELAANDLADVVFIDSRTGVTEMGGVCTRQLADVVVSFCVPNIQNLAGVAAMSKSFGRKAVLEKRKRDMEVVVIPTRIDQSEIEKRNRFEKQFRTMLDEFTPPAFKIVGSSFWDLAIQYIPAYAYSEKLAINAPDSAKELEEAYKKMAAHLAMIAQGKSSARIRKHFEDEFHRLFRGLLPREFVPRRGVSEQEQLNAKIEALYPYSSPEEDEVAKRVLTRLLRLTRPGEIGEDTRLRVKVDDWNISTRRVIEGLSSAGLLIKGNDEGTNQETIELADDSLIRDWERLKGWLNDDRQFLLWRQQLQATIAEWEKNGRDDGALLSGGRLKIAKQWQDVRSDYFNEAEMFYVTESARHSRRQTKMRTAVFATAIVMLILTVVGWATWQHERELAKREQAALKLSTDYITAGNDRMRLNSSEEALEQFTKAVNAKPDNPNAYYYRGLAYFENLTYDSAINDYTKAIELRPSFAEAYANRGRAYRNIDKVDLAIADYDKAIDINPRYAEAFNYRGYAYFKKGKDYYDRALADCNTAINIDPKYPNVYDSRGNIFLEKGDFSSAIADFDKAINLDPRLAVAYTSRGFAFYKKGSFNAAVINLNQAIILRPNYPDALYYRGLVDYELGYLDSAITDYTDAIKLKPNYFEAYLNRGLAYNKKGSSDEAIANFTEAVKLHPDSPEAYLNRGLAYKNRKGKTTRDNQSAADDFQKGLELTTNPQLRQTASQILRELKATLEQPATPRVLVNYNDPNDKSQVEDISNHIGLTIDIQHVENRKAETKGDVRYYHKEDSQNADRIRKAFMSYFSDKGILLNLRLLYLGDRYSNVDPGTIEVWFPSLSQGKPSSSSLEQQQAQYSPAKKKAFPKKH